MPSRGTRRSWADESSCATRGSAAAACYIDTGASDMSTTPGPPPGGDPNYPQQPPQGVPPQPGGAYPAPPQQPTQSYPPQQGYGGGGGGGGTDVADFARRHLRTPETKEFFKSSEF